MIAIASVLIVPFLAIAEEKRLAVSLQGEILASKSPGSGSRCICDADTVTKPVLDVIVPSQRAAYGNFAVLEVEDIHHFGNSVGAFRDVNLSILSALFEGVHERRRVIFRAGGSDSAETASLGHPSEGRHS